MDDQLLSIMLSHYSPHLSLLASRAKLGEFSDIDPVIVARFLDLVAARFANIVIDMPRSWNSWTESILLGSQTCYIVTELTVPGLRAARRYVVEIHERLGEDANPKVIVNKNSRHWFKTGISAKEAEDVLGDALAGYIGNEASLVREAIDRGVPVSELKRRNKVTRDLEQILFGGK
jgi:pilus assembly protein CpaE